MSYNYGKLDGKITEHFGSRYAFAEAMGLSETTLSKKMSSKVQWKQDEMSKACALLKIPIKEMHFYFFNY